MGSLHTALVRELKGIPHEFLKQLISKKLEEENLGKIPNLANALVEHVVSGVGEPFI